MSEYQYYEFRAVDRPLTNEEKALLRRISSRGEITSTSFKNVYHWGDFKGDPLELMKTMFDAHVYVTNWGYQRLMLKIPSRALDPDEASQYLAEEGLTIDEGEGQAILTFTYNSEGGDHDEPETVVTVTLAALQGGRTRLTLRHTAIETEASRALHETGWSRCFDRFSCVFSRR